METSWTLLSNAGVPVDRIQPVTSSQGVGVTFPGIEVAPLIAAENEWTEAFDALEAQRGRFVSTKEKDAALKRAVEAFHARAEEAAATYDAIEEKRKPTIETCQSARAEIHAELLGEALPRVRELLIAEAEFAAMESAAKDKNPAARHSASRPAPRLIGGSLIDQLESSVLSVGQAEIYYLDGAQLAKYQAGEPATDLSGTTVPPGLPAKRVRRSYPRGSLRPVAVQSLQGGVA